MSDMVVNIKKLQLEVDMEITFENYEERMRTNEWSTYQVGKLAADLFKKEQEAKRLVKEETARAFLDAKESMVAGKTPSDKVAEHIVELDPRVQAAHMKAIQMAAARKDIECLMYALQRQSSYFPGFQGQANLLRKEEY